MLSTACSRMGTTKMLSLDALKQTNAVFEDPG
jgi:hypothetical protein